jgi:hypothetical protein
MLAQRGNEPPQRGACHAAYDLAVRLQRPVAQRQ